MKVENLFTDKIAIKIWDQYFQRVKRLGRPLATDQQRDLSLEIQDHLLESFHHESGEDEAEKLLNAIEKIGDPEVYINPMLADKLLSSGARSMNPKTIFKGLYFNLYGSFKQFLVSFFISFGYLVSFTLALMAILEIFFPNSVGLFISDKGTPAMGVIHDAEFTRTDILGYWSIPMNLGFAILIYLGLTRRLMSIRNKRVKQENNVK